jgi:hypothetical protein
MSGNSGQSNSQYSQEESASSNNTRPSNCKSAELNGPCSPGGGADAGGGGAGGH